jgi:predicted subunit of tRNA(5-methylaminomethyl-2-thiouridylate) methyltransferase
MGSNLSFGHRDAISHLRQTADIVSNMTILSLTDDIAKTAQQIALENNLPISSTHKSSIDSGDQK